MDRRPRSLTLLALFFATGLCPLAFMWATVHQRKDAEFEATLRYAAQEGIRPDAFEFQMLYGVRRDLQRKLVADGWRVRVYVPFGTHWYPYLMRRLAERPANMLFLAGSVMRETPLGFPWPNGRKRRRKR